MRILFLTFYYPPDLSAGSFRAAALVAALQARAQTAAHIDVITTLPNRYRTFSNQAPAIERHAGLEISRIDLPSHRSDMLGQSLAFQRFAREALRRVRGRDYDLVFATSSRLMTAALGAWISRRKGTPLYLDIRDIFVDTINDILPHPTALLARLIFSRIESWTMRSADCINLVSPGFDEYFHTRYRGSRLSRFTNGIDDEFLTPQPVASRAIASSPATILYAGNIGEGQGLHDILPGLALALSEQARFIVIGDGGRRAVLERSLANAGVKSVELRAPVSRVRLLEEYRAADVLFLHLGDHAAFEKVLPSKLFEYAALGKPVLAGVAGYAARFIREEISNAAVFTPCNVDAAVRAFETLELVDRARPEFISKYARVNIARAMAEEVLAVAHARG